MSHWPIIGHTWAVELLQRAIANNQLSHAYLFTGPEGVGKTTLGVTFAQALLCKEENAPCGQCPTCRRIAAGVHPDVWLVEPEGNLIRVEQIREVVREASRRPLEATHRVFILSHMERAHPAAANALLKTLEEPAAHVVLILTAPSEDVILPTLTSRCQVLHLRPVAEEVLEHALRERWQMDPKRAHLLARLSGGRPGWAVRAQEDAHYWQLRDDLFEMVAAFAQNGSRWVRLEMAEKWAKLDISDVQQRLHMLERILRDILIAQAGQRNALRHVDKGEIIEVWATELAQDDVQGALRQALVTERHLKANVNKRLALDVLFLHMPAVRKQIQQPSTTTS